MIINISNNYIRYTDRFSFYLSRNKKYRRRKRYIDSITLKSVILNRIFRKVKQLFKTKLYALHFYYTDNTNTTRNVIIKISKGKPDKASFRSLNFILSTMKNSLKHQDFISSLWLYRK